MITLKIHNSALFVILGLVVGGLGAVMLLDISIPKVNGFFYSYQTLTTGLLALIAAIITAVALSAQTKQASSDHNRELEIGNLTILYSLYHKRQTIAHSLAGDIYSLIHRAEERQYLENFKEQIASIKRGQPHRMEAFPLYNNYFTIFESMCRDLGCLDKPLPHEIGIWYNTAKGFLDTVKGVNEGEYKNDDQTAVGESLFNDLTNLIETGKQLGTKLSIYSDEHLTKANEIQDQIKQKTNYG